MDESVRRENAADAAAGSRAGGDGSQELSPRVRVVCDLGVAEAREGAGRHEYDGVIQDLSPDGVRSGLARLAAARAGGGRQADPHDEAHLAAFEDKAQAVFGELQIHRSNPLVHLDELDVSCYDREYAPQAERDAARTAHLTGWPAAVDQAIAALDRVSSPVAKALLAAVRGLAAGIPAGTEPAVREAALSAHARLVGHIERASAVGDPDPALGSAGLTTLLRSAEAIEVDLDALAERADRERDRLRARLVEDCARIEPGRPAMQLARELVRDHPDGAGVLDAARGWTTRAIAFTRERDLVPYHDGACVVTPTPEAHRWSMAAISLNAPAEPEAPSRFYVTPPDPSWPEREAEEWLEVFSDTTLPVIAVHEVAPGHFSHGRALRRAVGEVRRTLYSSAFIEGWAHYAEELCVEEGYLAGDPRFAVGVWLEALVRVTRLACAIGVHTAGMTVEEAARRFESDTHLSGPAALSEARRATFDPTYGRYTWGKLEILALRERARKQWGAAFTLRRFHTALLSLGSPPLGLIGAALDRGLPVRSVAGGAPAVAVLSRAVSDSIPHRPRTAVGVAAGAT